MVLTRSRRGSEDSLTRSMWSYRAHSLKWTRGSNPETWRRSAARPRSAFASVLFRILGLPSRYDSAVRCTIRRVVVLQFEGLTRIALVALAAAVLGLDQQTVAHHRHRNRSYGCYCTATLNTLAVRWPNSRKDALASSFEIDALPRCQRAGETQLVAVSVVDVEVPLAPSCVRG